MHSLYLTRRPPWNFRYDQELVRYLEGTQPFRCKSADHTLVKDIHILKDIAPHWEWIAENGVPNPLALRLRCAPQRRGRALVRAKHAPTRQRTPGEYAMARTPGRQATPALPHTDLLTICSTKKARCHVAAPRETTASSSLNLGVGRCHSRAELKKRRSRSPSGGPCDITQKT